MNKIQMAVSSAVLALSAVSASADTFTVDGGSITISGGTTFTATSSVYENIITSTGQTLSGVGEVFSINGAPVANFCSSACEMTFRFTGYTATTATTTSANFTGGTFQVFVGLGANNDFNPTTSTGSAADLAAATNGTLFLNLVGHPVDAAGNTITSGLLPIGVTGDFAFFGDGLLDVGPGAGVANAAFNTNTIAATFGGPADLSFTSSGNTLGEPHPAECTPQPGLSTQPECVFGSADLRGFVGKVPEPGTLALLGIALGGLALRRRKQAA
jgi:PEP-CTERM motif-containing protein